MDVHTKEQRSYNMSRVKSKNTKPEILMFKMLRTSGYQFRKHYAVPGNPDIAFPKLRLALFIDGEFWHGKNFSKWKLNLSSFWLEKISSNIKRDRHNRYLLKKEGWHVLKIWGRDIAKNPVAALKKVEEFFKNYSY